MCCRVVYASNVHSRVATIYIFSLFPRTSATLHWMKRLQWLQFHCRTTGGAELLLYPRRFRHCCDASHGRTVPPARVDGRTTERTPTFCRSRSLATVLFKMAADSSAQPAGTHASLQENALPRDAHSSAEGWRDEAAPAAGASLRELPQLESEELCRRLAGTLRELSNRRKIVLKNLPQDTTSQEIHDILKAYELKYCYVDKNKGTAFVTLLNGEQAQDAIRTFHQSIIRGREITVQLQPTDALLCVTNLPHTLTGTRFEELVRTYGNIERCFLVYSECTGHSKGYGFVEYMKKDSASRARAELLGRLLEGRALMVQWADVNQLTVEHLHSKCLCVDRLPADCNSEKLAHVFGERHKAVFCQLAQDEGSPVGGFAVMEYETSKQAEDVLVEMDQTMIGGQEIRVSFCAPGTSGRSTLAALIAAQGVMSNNKRGLLPEPSLAQLLSSMNNPAALQVLLRSYLAGGSKHAGKFGQMQNVPIVQSPLAAGLLHLRKVQQNALLGNGLILQNLLQMQLAQQQLLQMKDNSTGTGAGLLGDPLSALLQKTMAPASAGKGLLGEAPNELSQDALHVSSTTAGLMTCPPNRLPQAMPSGPEQDGTAIIDKKHAAARSAGGSQLGAQGLLHARGGCNSIFGSVPPGAAPNPSENSSPGMANCQTSLLGEPPKDVKLPSNPYLNLASVLPGIVLQAPTSSKVTSHGEAPPPKATPLYTTEAPADYMHQYVQQYSQEAMQWYQHYQSHSSSVPLESNYRKEQTQEAAAAAVSYGDYSSYMQAVGQYYPNVSLTPAQVFHHRDTSKEADLSKSSMSSVLHSVANGASTPATNYGPLTVVPGYMGLQQAAPSSGTLSLPTPVTMDWSQSCYSQNQVRGLKRNFSQLLDGSVDQQSQGLVGQYADQYKKRRM